jgi:exonuclease SbcD
MKILHFGDVHIGMENYGHIDSTTGLNTRFLDFLNSMDQIINYAKKNNPDIILFSGDAYKDRNPSPTHQREFAIRIKELAQIAPVVMVVGNHDLPQAMEKANTLDIFSALKVKNLYVSRIPEILLIETRSGLIQVLTLPWMTKSKLLENIKFSNKNQKELQKLLSTEIIKIVKNLIKKSDKKIPIIVNAHISFENAIFSSERSVMLGSDLIISKNTFRFPQIKYVALGHIHKFQIVQNHPLTIYSGSIDRIDWGEEKEKKGFVMIDVKSKTDYQFIPIITRKFTTININLTNSDDFNQSIKEQIQKYDVADAIVRVKVKVPEELADQITDNDIRRNLSSANYISSISFEIPETHKIKELKHFEKSSTPIETLEGYLDFMKIPSKRKAILEKYAISIFEEIE